MPREVSLLFQTPGRGGDQGGAKTSNTGAAPLGPAALDGKRLRGFAPASQVSSTGMQLAAAFASRFGGAIFRL